MLLSSASQQAGGLTKGCYKTGGVGLPSTEPYLGSACSTSALFAAHREEGAEQSENLLKNKMKPTLSFRS